MTSYKCRSQAPPSAELRSRMPSLSLGELLAAVAASLAAAFRAACAAPSRAASAVVELGLSGVEAIPRTSSIVSL